MRKHQCIRLVLGEFDELETIRHEPLNQCWWNKNENSKLCQYIFSLYWYHRRRWNNIYHGIEYLREWFLIDWRKALCYRIFQIGLQFILSMMKIYFSLIHTNQHFNQSLKEEIFSIFTQQIHEIFSDSCTRKKRDFDLGDITGS